MVFLDSEPLGLASQARGKPNAHACWSWLAALEAAGAEVVIPEIIDYEIRRELVRVGGHGRVAAARSSLDPVPALIARPPRAARAAELWALVRRAGLPTAHPQTLDVDAILAGQALTAVG